MSEKIFESDLSIPAYLVNGLLLYAPITTEQSLKDMPGSWGLLCRVIEAAGDAAWVRNEKYNVEKLIGIKDLRVPPPYVLLKFTGKNP